MSSLKIVRCLIVVACFFGAACQSIGDGDRASGAMSADRPSADRELRLANALTGLEFDEQQVGVDPALADEAGWATEEQLQVLLGEAEALLKRGRAIRAIAAFTGAVIAAPDRAEPYEGLGRALVREGESQRALAAFMTVLSIQPEWVDVRFAAGNTLERLGRSHEAIVIWQDVLDQDPGFADAHGRLAVAHFLLGRPDLSRHHLASAQELGGAFPTQLPVMLDTGAPLRASVAQGHPAGQTPPESAVQVGPQVHVNASSSSGTVDETTCIAIDSAPMEAIAAWNDALYDTNVGVAVTLDGGQTWTDFVFDDDSFCDSMTAGDQRTGNLWVGGLDDDLSIFVSRKNPGATDFQPATYSGVADKPWMVAGRRPDDPDSTRLYVTANIDFAYSDDLGQTWTSLSTATMEGIGHLPRVGPNGELYIVYWDFAYGVKMQRSFDGGATLSPPMTIATRMAFWDIYDSPQVPGGFRVPPLTYLAVDPIDGTLYCVYFDVTEFVGSNANVDLYFTRSSDQGDTWSVPTVINGDGNPPGDQFFPWLETDSSGRLHLLFFDTRNTQQSDFETSAYIDAYYAWSEDSGDTWTEHRLSPFAFNTGAASDFLGDYLGMGVGHNRAYPVYPFVHDGVHKILSNQIVWTDDSVIFGDGFESGDTSRW